MPLLQFTLHLDQTDIFDHQIEKAALGINKTKQQTKTKLEKRMNRLLVLHAASSLHIPASVGDRWMLLRFHVHKPRALINTCHLSKRQNINMRSR